jgi:hypothetical protein
MVLSHATQLGQTRHPTSVIVGTHGRERGHGVIVGRQLRAKVIRIADVE